MRVGVNWSQISSFNGCRMKWHFQYRKLLTPRVTRPKMQFGTLVHRGLEAALRLDVELRTSLHPNQPIHASLMEAAAAIDELVSKYIETHGLDEEEAAFAEEEGLRAMKVTERAYAHFIKDFDPILINGVPAIEFKVRKRLLRNKQFDHVHGTIDVVAKERRTGRVWVMDFKVRSQLQPLEDEEVNLQMPIYQGILLFDYKIETVGSICFQISNSAPAIPKQNKDGSMSKADCKTDWPTYEEALLEHGLDPDDYQDMKAKLDQKEWFRLSRDFRTPEQLKRVWEHYVIPSARQMSRAQIDIQRNMSAWNCKGCQFRDLCLTDLRGGDVGYLEENDFIISVEATEAPSDDTDA